VNSFNWNSDAKESCRRRLPTLREIPASKKQKTSVSSPVTCSVTCSYMYKHIKQKTGGLGGNSSSGAIYGELTKGSMQKVVNLMKEYTDFGPLSKFIDVGSGVGKPNLHVMQDPGVAFSYGIEMELSRWVMSVVGLNAVLQETGRANSKLTYNPCMFDHDNIMSAHTFDPFSHVYMFSIG
jgi:hypothetical protein